MPSVDIAPNANAEHVAALVYTQVTGADGFGPGTDLFVVRFLGDLADINEHIQVVDPDEPEFADGLYPSIAINRQESSPSDITASIAFMGQDNGFNQTDQWHPRVARMILFDYIENEPPGEPHVDWSGDAFLNNTEDIVGNYNLSDIPFSNPGVSAAIVTTNDDRFWAAWANRIEMEPPPERIRASWGFAGN